MGSSEDEDPLQEPMEKKTKRDTSASENPGDDDPVIVGGVKRRNPTAVPKGRITTKLLGPTTPGQAIDGVGYIFAFYFFSVLCGYVHMSLVCVSVACVCWCNVC